MKICTTPHPNKPSQKNFQKTPNAVKFQGHLGSEKYAKNGIKFLISETALFRDMQTKNFIKEYIEKTFTNKNQIKILIGGCSTGEEAYTFSMLLKSLPQRLKITGFDISKQSIESAKSKKLIMQQEIEPKKNLYRPYSKRFNDEFLCFPTAKELTPAQLKQKELFDDFFEITTEKVPRHKESLQLKFTKWFTRNVYKIYVPEYDSKIVKLRENKAVNCDFVNGDILNLNEITKGEKVEIITFTNAMYHLISENIANGLLRRVLPNAEETVTTIAQNVKNNLNPKGIFVLGEDEILQTMDTTIVPKVFKNLGFQPLNKTDEHLENVWQLP